MESFFAPLKGIIFLSSILLTLLAGKNGCQCGNKSNSSYSESSSSHSSQGNSNGKQSSAPTNNHLPISSSHQQSSAAPTHSASPEKPSLFNEDRIAEIHSILK